MKTKLKIIYSLSIFSLLFSMAWSWDSKHKREFYEPVSMNEQNVVGNTMPLNVNFGNQEETNHFFRARVEEVFKPREYVRIKHVHN